MPLRIFTVTGTSPAARTARRDDVAEQVALPRQRRAAALAGDLGDRAAEVEVDVVGAVLGDEHAHGPRRSPGRRRRAGCERGSRSWCVMSRIVSGVALDERAR